VKKFSQIEEGPNRIYAGVRWSFLEFPGLPGLAIKKHSSMLGAATSRLASVNPEVRGRSSAAVYASLATRGPERSFWS